MNENLNRRRNLCRLILARDSVDAALRGISIIIQGNMELGGPLLTAMQSAVVVSYGRAFVEMKPLGNISNKWSKFADPAHQSAHDLLYNQRMTKIAHVDYTPGLVTINPPGAVRTDGLVQNGFGFDIGYQLFAPKAYQSILGVCAYLVVEMHQAVSLEIVAIYGEDKSLNAPFDLLTEADMEILDKGTRKSR